MQKHFIAKFMVLSLLIVTGISVAQAQITERLKANIPFNFYVANRELPAGEYIVQMKDPEMGLMEITSVAGKATALFVTYNTQINAAPGKGELIFERYGDKYFLEKLFEPGDRNGSELIESKMEKKLEKEGAAKMTAVWVE